MPYIVEYIKSLAMSMCIDVLVLNEADAYNNFLLQHLKDVFPHDTYGWMSSWTVSSKVLKGGGVYLLSKHNLTDLGWETFESCAEDDCLAAKGFGSVWITKGKRRFRVVATHAQANQAGDNSHIRSKQMNSLRQQIAQSADPTFFVGDFNMNYLGSGKSEVEQFEKLMDAHRTGPAGATWTPRNEFNEGNGGLPEELDFIFHSPLNGGNATAEVFTSSSPTPWTFPKKRALSDHEPVVARFNFPEDQ